MTVPEPGPERAAAMSPTGVAGNVLQRALHDLRGPLNTLAIVHEILRSSSGPMGAAATDPLATAARAVRNLGTMLDRLRAVADTRADVLVPVALRSALRSAVERAQPLPGIAIEVHAAGAPELRVASCPRRLAAALDTLLACAGAALPKGGTVRLECRPDDERCVVAVSCDGPGAELPPANLLGRLDENLPGPADWFRLSCQFAGLAAELAVDGGETPPRISVRLPRT